jgi:hypothetical protein
MDIKWIWRHCALVFRGIHWACLAGLWALGLGLGLGLGWVLGVPAACGRSVRVRCAQSRSKLSKYRGPYRWAWVPTGRFQCPQVCIKGLGAFAHTKIGPADSPPPRWPPGPGFLGVEPARRGCLARTIAQLVLPVAPVTHQPAPGDTQGNVSRQLAGAVVFGVELLISCQLRRSAHTRRVGRFFNRSAQEAKMRGAAAQALGCGARRPGRDGCATSCTRGGAAPGVSWIVRKRSSVLLLQNQEIKLESNHPEAFGYERWLAVFCQSHIGPYFC